MSTTHATPVRFLAGLLLSLTTMGCASTNAPSPFENAGVSSDVPFDPSEMLPNEISRAEINSRGRNDLTAMALIRRLRPGWLTARGQASFVDGWASYPTVYVDEIRHGGLPTLHRIPTAEIEKLEFYNTADATTRWGTGHTAGVINIVTGRAVFAR